MELNRLFEKQLWNIIFLPICWTQHTDQEQYVFLEKNWYYIIEYIWVPNEILRTKPFTRPCWGEFNNIQRKKTRVSPCGTGRHELRVGLVLVLFYFDEKLNVRLG